MTPLSLLIPSFIAGILMFLAPCTLPVVPGYLAFIGGVPEGRRGARRSIVTNAVAFVVGFSLIFIAFGLFAAFLGTVLGSWRFALARGAGVILVFFGLTMMGLLRLPVLSGEYRARIPSWLTIGKPQSSFLIGALFALGWSPCIGPILGSILFLASAQGTALQGAYLLAVFSLGFSLPFLLTAFFISKASSYIGRASAWARPLEILGGLILVALGILMAMGDMGQLASWGYGLLNFIGYDRLLNYL